MTKKMATFWIFTLFLHPTQLHSQLLIIKKVSTFFQATWEESVLDGLCSNGQCNKTTIQFNELPWQQHGRQHAVADILSIYLFFVAPSAENCHFQTFLQKMYSNVQKIQKKYTQREKPLKTLPFFWFPKKIISLCGDGMLLLVILYDLYTPTTTTTYL